MGIYYYLINDTKKQYVHYDNCVKSGPIQYNEAVHMALVNYMFENRGDKLRFLADYIFEDDEKIYDYEEINLKNYKYHNEKITQLIEEKIKQINTPLFAIKKAIDLLYDASLTLSTLKLNEEELTCIREHFDPISENPKAIRFTIHRLLNLNN